LAQKARQRLALPKSDPRDKSARELGGGFARFRYVYAELNPSLSFVGELTAELA
jgi:hypothetical protein